MRVKFFLTISIFIISLTIIVCSTKKNFFETNFDKEDLEAGITLGEKTAPVHIVEYFSVNCVACKKNHENLRGVLANYLDNKIIRYTLKPIDLKQKSVFEDIYLYRSSKIDMKYLDLFYSDKSESKSINDKVKSHTSNSLLRERKKELNHIQSEVLKYNIVEFPSMYINKRKLTGLYTAQEFQKIVQNYLK